MIQKSMIGILTLAFIVSGCGLKMTSRTGSGASGLSSFNGVQAAITTYRYAFSGQVVDGASGSAIGKFSVSLVGGDSSIVMVVNPLGQSNGLFHVSRDASAPSATVGATVVISAPGYQSIVQPVDIGIDCTTSGCTGTVPQIFAMKAGVAANQSPSAVTADNVASGTLSVAQQVALSDQLQASGKLETTADITGNTISKAVVLLNPQTSTTATPSVSGILGAAPTGGLSAIATVIGTITSAILPWITALNPQLGAAFAAIKLVMTYLQPIINQVLATNNNPFVQIVAAVIQAFIGSTPATTTSGSTLAAAGLGSLPSTNTTSAANSPNPFSNLLTTILQNPSSIVVPAATKGRNAARGAVRATAASLVSNYLQPLIQALNSSSGATFAALFNQLVQQVGLSGLASFPNGPAELDQFGKLAPFLQSLVQGLNSGDAAALTQLLTPVVSAANPAAVLQQLLNPANPAFANVANAVFPALQVVASNWVPGKQVFGAQLLHAVFTGRLSGTQVQQDFAGAPSAVVTGNGSSLLKIAQLPNVEKVVVLSP
jgi:hypothetical protein